MRRSIPSLLIIFLAACNFVSLERLQVTYFPSTHNAIVQTGETLWIEFSLPVVRKEAEAVLSVSGESGSVHGELSWSGNKLTFAPIPELEKGKRYVFTYQGTAESIDGKKFSLDILIPFYADTAAPSPRLVSYSPSCAENVSMNQPVLLEFSQPMDTAGLPDEFQIVPHTEFSVAWNPEASLATLTPEEGWRNLTYYEWSLSTDMRDQEGICLACSYDSSFIVQEDLFPPSIVGVQPAHRSGSTYLPIEPTDPDAPLDDLKFQDAILLAFSEPVDLGSLDHGFRLAPALEGSLHSIGQDSYVFQPAYGYTMNQQYFLYVSQGVKDLSGNPMGEDFEIWFTPDIEPQSITRIRCQGSTVQDYYPGDYNQSSPLVFDLEETGGDKLHTFTITFAAAIDEESRSQLTDAVYCEAFFPSSVLDPDLESISWNFQGTAVTLRYAGFEHSPPGIQKNLYRLVVYGGPDASMNQQGSFLEEDVWILLEAPES